jgi:hypothetical protein
MMQSILGIDEELKIDKCLVAVLHDRICKRIIAMRSEAARNLNLVPFDGGTTINLGALDQRTKEVSDDSLNPNRYQDIAEALNEFVPGLKLKSCQTSFYICQKLSNVEFSSHPLSKYGTRHYFWLTFPNNCFFLYPGKFTLAQAAARVFAQHLRTPHQPESFSRGSVQSMAPPSIAPRLYYDTASHVLALSEAGELEFREIRG